MVHVSTLSRAQQASRERVVEDDDDPNLGSRQPRIRKLQSVEEGGGGWPWPMAFSLLIRVQSCTETDGMRCVGPDTNQTIVESPNIHFTASASSIKMYSGFLFLRLAAMQANTTFIQAFFLFLFLFFRAFLLLDEISLATCNGN